jgi:hypothetical protein
MANRFQQKFPPDSPRTIPSSDGVAREVEAIAPGFSAFCRAFGGCSFGQGLYRFHEPDSLPRWNGLVVEAFPRLASRIHCFGYDWLGRQFVLDRLRIVDGEAQVLLCDVGFDEVLEIPASFSLFHEVELVDYTSDALAEPFYHRWVASGGARPLRSQCVGYRVSPLLGGQDKVSNLEITDLEVYWSIHAQINAKVKK